MRASILGIGEHCMRRCRGNGVPCPQFKKTGKPQTNPTSPGTARRCPFPSKPASALFQRGVSLFSQCPGQPIRYGSRCGHWEQCYPFGERVGDRVLADGRRSRIARRQLELDISFNCRWALIVQSCASRGCLRGSVVNPGGREQRPCCLRYGRSISRGE